MEVAGLFEHFELEHEADIGAVRRRFATLAAAAGLDESRSGDAGLVATEAATNVIRHARHGGALLATLRDGTRAGVLCIAWDRGPGMDVEACMRDGMSTAGTPGKGLGAIARIASQYDIYARRGGGTIVVATIYPRAPVKPAREKFAIGAVCVPYPGEPIAGDGYAAHFAGDVATLLVCDGLGHGDGAAQATAAVLDVFHAAPLDAPSAILARAHDAARSTRGAAATIVRVDRTAATCTVAGVGNVQAWIVGGSARQLVTQHGTLGQATPRVREEVHPLGPQSFVVLHSDGIRTRWNLDDHPGLPGRMPTTIAAALWRDFGRGRDDTTVVVLREDSA